VALGMNGAIRCNVNAIGPISPARALGRLRAPSTLPARGPAPLVGAPCVPGGGRGSGASPVLPSRWS
jgi:hypothetical protein